MIENGSALGESKQVTALFVILLLIGSLLPIWAATRHHTFLNDDTYITLTYAQNLASGRGFVFNHPPPTLGTTTPLLVSSVAALARLVPWIEIHVLAVYFSAFCWMGTAWVVFLFRCAWDLSAWQAGLLGLILLGTGWIGFLGMEAHLFAFLLMLSLSLFYADRPFLSGLCTGLLFLTRGEGVLVWLMLTAISLCRSWIDTRRLDSETLREGFILTAGFAIPVALWSIYAYATFGVIVPNTLSVKQAQGAATVSNQFMVRLIHQWLPDWGRSFLLGRWPYLNLWWLLVGIGVLSTVVRRRKWLALLLWIMLYISGYGVLRVSGYWWYQLPILFVAHVFIGIGLIAVVDFLLARRWPDIVRYGIATAVAAIVVIAIVFPTARGVTRYQGDPRGPTYIAVSQWLSANTDASDSVAFVEIGYLGYYTDNRIIDLAGLVIPEIATHAAEGDHAWAFWEYLPDYYVYTPEFDWVLGDIRADSRFDELYEPVASLPGIDDGELTIFRHVVVGEE